MTDSDTTSPSSSNSSSLEAPEDSPPKGDSGKIREVLREENARSLLHFFQEEVNLSESSARTYRASWTDFRSWCDGQDCEALPADPEVVAQYLEDRSAMSMGTLRNRVSAIAAAHSRADFEHPTEAPPVKSVLRALSEEKSVAETARSPAEKLQAGRYSPSDILKGGPSILKAYLEDLYASGRTTTADETSEERRRACQMWRDPIIEKNEASAGRLTPAQNKLIPEPKFDLAAMRDRAALLLMTEAKCSRADLARLDLIDVLVEETQVKTDLDHWLVEEKHATKAEIWVGVRQKNGMPDRTLCLPVETDLRLCPARAISAWIVGAALEGGALFRPFGSHGTLKERRIGPSSINLLVERAAEKAGLDPNEWTPTRLADPRGED